MKVLLFTHEQDIDGIGSAILGRIAFSDFCYVPCKTFEIDSNFKKYLDDKIINDDPILKNKVLVLDHHKTEKSNDRYDFVNIILECSKGPTSGTYLFFEYLINNRYLERTEILEELVELTRQYDTWEWVNYNNKKARMLHLLFEQVGYKKYIEIIENIISNNSTIVFSNDEMEIINDWENKFKQDSQKILEGMIVYPVIINSVEYKIGYMYTKYKYRNDLNELIKQNNVYDIDLIGMLFTNMDVVSYRGVKDIDVSIVPTYFGGKGHKGAGTNPTNNEKFSKVLSKLKFNNIIDN